jgi:hypothetical protein
MTLLGQKHKNGAATSDIAICKNSACRAVFFKLKACRHSDPPKAERNLSANFSIFV